MNIRAKRLIAYFIDLLIISFLTYLLSMVNVINPNKDKYIECVKELNNYTSSLREDISNGNIKIDDYYNAEYIDHIQKVEYYGMSYSITEVLVIVLYYSLFSFFFDGQTIGKKIIKIRTVDNKKEKVPLYKLFIKSFLMPISTGVFIYNCASNILCTSLIFIKGMPYLYIYMAVNFITFLFAIVDIIIGLITNRTLRDRITNTSVREMSYD